MYVLPLARLNVCSTCFQPFQGINPGVFQDADSKWIELIDGSSNKENIPLGPLFVKARHLDVIVAIDAGAEDADDWPVSVSILTNSRFLLLSVHPQESIHYRVSQPFPASQQCRHPKVPAVSRRPV